MLRYQLQCLHKTVALRICCSMCACSIMHAYMERLSQGRAVLTRLAKQCARRWIYALLYTGIEQRESKCCIPSLQAVPSPSQFFGRIRRALPDRIKCAALPLRYAHLAEGRTHQHLSCTKKLSQAPRGHGVRANGTSAPFRRRARTHAPHSLPWQGCSICFQA